MLKLRPAKISIRKSKLLSLLNQIELRLRVMLSHLEKLLKLSQFLSSKTPRVENGSDISDSPLQPEKLPLNKNSFLPSKPCNEKIVNTSIIIHTYERLNIIFC
jgi:hypothetical protein